MGRQQYSPEQINGKLGEVEVVRVRGQTVGQDCRSLGVVEQTFSRWAGSMAG